MTSGPFFSIIIPTYNRSPLIGKAIHSVAEQTCKDFELIVVDDGSTDDTPEVVNQLVHALHTITIRYIRIPNSERGAARNAGLDNARGKYVTFLDSDDILYPCYLSYAYESLCKYGYPPFFHLAYEVKDLHGTILTKVNRLKPDDDGILVDGNPLSCLGVFMERSMISQYRFNEDRALAGSEDYELWIRLVANVGIKTDNRIAAALIEHTGRSERQHVKKNLEAREKLFFYYAFKDEMVKKKYTARLNRMHSFWNSYIALHLLLSGSRREGFRYAAKSVGQYPWFVFRRRFFTLIRLILTGNKIHLYA